MEKHHQGIGMTSRRTRERMIKRLQEQGITDNRILDVMLNTPRHIFVDDALASRAYEDTALPIGNNQTISQPYIVAKMTELLLENRSLSRVLDIGTGCGYQAAILAQLVENVFSVERIGALLEKARNHVSELKLKNIRFQHSDGGWGWPENAPYDGIMVAAAPAEIPKSLLDQLADGGVMLIPIGKKGGQELQRVTRKGKGYDVEVLEAVSFVPFLSGRDY